MARQAVIPGGGSGLAAKVLGWGVLLVVIVFIVKRPEQAADLFLALVEAASRAIDAGSKFLGHLS